MEHPELVDEHKILYYQAYTLLNESTQKFRDFGQHIFRNDPEKVNEYKSTHYINMGKQNQVSSQSIEITE